MSDEYVDLGKTLQQRLAISDVRFADYLFERARVLIAESGDPGALDIDSDIAKGAFPEDKIMKYADLCEYATSNEACFYCNYVFLFFLIVRRLKYGSSEKAFQHLCDEYSSLVGSVSAGIGGAVAGDEDDGYETDLNEIRAHFETHTDENSTFRGFMAKLS